MGGPGHPAGRSGRLLRLRRAAGPPGLAGQARHRRRRCGRPRGRLHLLLRGPRLRSAQRHGLVASTSAVSRGHLDAWPFPPLPRGVRRHHGHPARRDAPRATGLHRRGLHGRHAHCREHRAPGSRGPAHPGARGRPRRHLLHRRGYLQVRGENRLGPRQAPGAHRGLPRHGGGLSGEAARAHALRRGRRRREDAPFPRRAHLGSHGPGRRRPSAEDLREERRDDARPGLRARPIRGG